MIFAGVLLVGIIIGYVMCYLAREPSQTRQKGTEDAQTILVKRSKPSLRSPLQTHRIAYEKYQTKDTGLYAPVKAKGGTKDEVEIGR